MTETRNLARLKIALIILHADPARGGAERYTADLFAALQARGNEVWLLTAHGHPAVAPDWTVVLPSPGLTRAGRYRAFLKSLDEHLAGTKYDIVHAMLPVNQCDLYHPHAGIAAESMASGHLKHPSSMKRLLAKWANRVNARRRTFAAVERRLLSSGQPPVVLCLSQYVKGFVRKHYDLPDAKLATLFNATNLERFDPQAIPDAGSRLRQRLNIDPSKVMGLMIAQDFARKGLREAIVALADVPGPRLILVVVGKEDPGPYRQLAEKQGVADRVIFAGTTQDPYSFYQAADFFVLPTRHDPCSLVVLEALAMGVPVLSTAFNGACEIMTDGVHGFVLRNPANPAALSRAMQQMLDDSRRNAMAAACVALRPALSYARHLDELQRIYAGMVLARSQSHG